MARRDGTGPMGQGPMTGRGMGPCAETRNDGAGLRRGRGRGMGMGRGFSPNQNTSKTQKELLQDQKDALKNQLKSIDEKLEGL